MRAAVLLLFALSAVAAVKDPWLRITTTHFELFTTAGERAGRDLVKQFEQVQSFFEQRFKKGIDPTRRARVILFRSEKEYEPYKPNQVAAAFYHPGEYRDFIVMTNSLNDSGSVAVHELTHLMVHQLAQELPVWLNEGLAELYRNLQPRGGKIMVGKDIPAHLYTLRQEKWIPLRTLLAADRESPLYNSKSGAGMFYAESWKLVHMLHLHPAYESRLIDLLRALRISDPEAAFRTAYGKSLDAVEQDLRNYLSGNSINTFLFDIQLSKSIDAPEVEAGAELPARLAVAEMLSGERGKLDQAQAAYAEIAKEYPDRWEVEEALGLFAWQKRNLADADSHFKRAESLGSKDPNTFLLWGRVLVYAGRWPEAVAVLSKTARMLPESDQVQLEYGSALLRNGNFGTALAALRSVKKVSAADAWRFYYDLAYATYRLSDTVGAKAIVAKARPFAETPAETRSLDQLEAALSRSPTGKSEEESAQPRLVRRTATPDFSAVDGALEEMECGRLARLHVRVEGVVKIFLIPDPRGVSIRSGTGEVVALDCGKLATPRLLRLEYQAAPEASGATGIVRSLEFK